MLLIFCNSTNRIDSKSTILRIKHLFIRIKLCRTSKKERALRIKLRVLLFRNIKKINNIYRSGTTIEKQK